MAGNRFEEGKFRPAGYSALVERYGLDAIPNWHISYVASSNTRVTERMGEAIEEVYPSSYWPGDTTGDHLEFALKYDGTNLAILTALFRKLDESEMSSFIARKPNGKYVRRLWYLYEFLTGRRLPFEDLTMGTYVDLLNPAEYYASAAVNRIRRQRVNDNLLGGPAFCPVIRRTQVLREFEEKDLRVGEKAPHDVHFLPHAGGEVVDLGFGPVGHVHKGKKLADAASGLAGRNPIELGEHPEVLLHGEEAVAGGFPARDHVDVPPDFHRVLHHIHPGHERPAGSRRKKGGKDFYERGLSCSIWPQKPKKLARPNLQAHPIEGEDFPFALPRFPLTQVENPGELFGLDRAFLRPHERLSLPDFLSRAEPVNFLGRWQGCGFRGSSFGFTTRT